MDINVSMQGSREEVIKELKGLVGILKISDDDVWLHIAPPEQTYRITCAPNGMYPGGTPKPEIKVIGKLECGSLQIVSRHKPSVDFEKLASLPLEERTPEKFTEHWIDEAGDPCKVVAWSYLPMFTEPNAPTAP